MIGPPLRFQTDIEGRGLMILWIIPWRFRNTDYDIHRKIGSNIRELLAAPVGV